MHNLIVSSYNLFLHSYRYGVENHIYCIKKQFQDEKILEVSGRKVGYLPLDSRNGFPETHRLIYLHAK